MRKFQCWWLFLWLVRPWAILAEGPHLLLTEILVDPAFAPDGVGEYLELGTTDSTPVILTDYELRVENKHWALSRFGSIAPGKTLLLCTDSLAAFPFGLVCGGELPGLTLPNGRPFALTISSLHDTVIWMVPRSRPGEALENSLDPNLGYLGLRPVFESFQGGTGSPGILPRVKQDQSPNPNVPSQEGPAANPIQTPLRISSLRFRAASISPNWSIQVGVGHTSHRSLQVVNKNGEVVRRWDFNHDAQIFKGDDQRLAGESLVNGPYVLILQDGSKRYRQAFIVSQGISP